MELSNMEELEITRLSEIQSTEVGWLRYPYIPLGKLSIIEGDPGSGKTMLILYLASLLSTASLLPTQTNNIISEPMTIIYQTYEDGYDDTIKPRLEKFKQVDFNRIVFIKEDKCSLTMLDERIEQAIIKEFNENCSITSCCDYSCWIHEQRKSIKIIIS